LKRREFITLLSGAAAVWPCAAHAQQSGVKKHVAVLAGNADNPTTRTYVNAFRKGLADAGWHEGRNITIEVRWGNGDAARITAQAAELVGLAPDAILATNTPTVRAFKQATETIPLVFAGLSDPIGDGFVSSLSRPGGNITGFTSFNAPIAGKWLEILKELSPSAQHAGVIFNPTTAPHSIFLPVMEVIASKLGVTVTPLPVTDQATIEAAIGRLAREPNSVLVGLPDIFLSLNFDRVFRPAIEARLPSIGPLRSYAIGGALASYGSDFVDLFHQAASYVARILRGEKPRDLPVQEPTRYELVINLKVAKAIGLTVPPTLLARADEVIE
jgi:putative ABC transport system substrate-binding protein